MGIKLLEIKDEFKKIETVNIKIAGIIFFSILTAIGAHIYIVLPWTPVPLTLQTFFVLSSGVVLGSSAGFLSQLLYILLGIVGMPVYSSGQSGIIWLSGITGGYILGFMFAGWIAGKITEVTKNNLVIVGGLIVADLTLLSCGTLWLKLVTGWNLHICIIRGFIPFLIGDLIKILLLSIFFVYYKDYKKRDLSSVGRAAGS